MLIIVEGCDGVGKTTVCDRLEDLLQDELDYDVARFRTGVPTSGHDPFATYERGLPDMRAIGDAAAVICDRWHWGEPIYSQLLGRDNTLPTAAFRHVELYAKARGAVVLLLEQSGPTIRRRLRERGDDLIRPSQAAAILNAYVNMRAKTGLPVVYHVDPTDEELRNVIKLAQTQMGVCAQLARFPSYVGGPWPEILLVGERRGGDPDQPDSAAFVPRNATSGRFLLEALSRHTWPYVGLVNAFEDDVPLLWTAVMEPRVVALGRKAFDRLRDQKVPCGGVPHPQYVRRFHHAAQEAYGRKIHEVSITQEDALSWRP